MKSAFCRALLTAVIVGIVVGGASGSVRLVGGNPISIQSAPWAVIVRYSPPNSNLEYDCSGSIVTPTIIVTSAFCLYDYDSSGKLEASSEITVTAGVTNLDSPAATDTEEDRTVSSIRIHPGFVYSASTDSTDDIAALTLVTPLNLNGKTVQSIGLPAPNASFPAGTAVTLAAFGAQTAGGYGGQLAAVGLSVEAQGHCGPNGIQGIAQSNGVILCASASGASMCDGDGGGPLATGGANPVLEGVAVAETQNCSPGSQTIFTYVGAPEILAFIQGNNSTQPTEAPRPSTQTTFWRLDWDNPLVAGDTLRCSTGGWGGSVQVTYAFVNTASGQVLQSGPSGKYAVPSSAVGTSIDCQISVSNAGGTTTETTNVATNVKPTPKLKLTAPNPPPSTPGQPLKLVVSLNGPPGLAGRIEVCATVPVAVVPHRCSSTTDVFYTLGFKHRFDLTYTIKPTAAKGRVPITIVANAGLATSRRTVSLTLR